MLVNYCDAIRNDDIINKYTDSSKDFWLLYDSKMFTVNILLSKMDTHPFSNLNQLINFQKFMKIGILNWFS